MLTDIFSKPFTLPYLLLIQIIFQSLWDQNINAVSRTTIEWNTLNWKVKNSESI